ncbi:MAG: hypothetical protein DDT20_01212 [Firmicutes bacterium]|nr:hypothetical protein [Bacillota bacterium]
MESRERDDKAFLTALEAVPLPHVDAPLFKAQLKARLLAEVTRPARSARPAPAVRSAWWRYALVAAALLVVLAWQMMPAPLPAFAYLEIEVNPAMRLTLNIRGEVIGIEPLDETARLPLSEIVFRRRPTAQVVAQILERLHGAALLDATSQVWLVVSPMGEARPEEIENLLRAAQTAVNTHTRRLLAQSTATHGLVVDRERYEVARNASLRPSQYTRVARAGVSASGMQGIVTAGMRLQAAGKMTGNRLREFTELIAELLELGMPESEAVELIEGMLAKGLGIENIARRLEKAADRIEEGQTLKEAVRELRDSTGRRKDQDEEDDRDKDKANERRPDQEPGRERERDDERERGDDGRGRDDERDHDEPESDDETDDGGN